MLQETLAYKGLKMTVKLMVQNRKAQIAVVPTAAMLPMTLTMLSSDSAGLLAVAKVSNMDSGESLGMMLDRASVKVDTSRPDAVLVVFCWHGGGGRRAHV